MPICHMAQVRLLGLTPPPRNIEGAQGHQRCTSSGTSQMFALRHLEPWDKYVKALCEQVKLLVQHLSPPQEFKIGNCNHVVCTIIPASQGTMDP